MSYSKKTLFFFNNNFFKNNNFSLNFNNISYDYTGSYLCGDLLFLQSLLNFFNILITDSKYKTYGCGSAVSSVCLVSFYLLSKYYFQILFLKDFHISIKLKLPSLKYHCSILVQKILYSSFSNYKNNYLLFYF